jgi:hypothetical protein
VGDHITALMHLELGRIRAKRQPVTFLPIMSGLADGLRAFVTDAPCTPAPNPRPRLARWTNELAVLKAMYDPEPTSGGVRIARPVWDRTPCGNPHLDAAWGVWESLPKREREWLVWRFVFMHGAAQLRDADGNPSGVEDGASAEAYVRHWQNGGTDVPPGSTLPADAEQTTWAHLVAEQALNETVWWRRAELGLPLTLTEEFVEHVRLTCRALRKRFRQGLEAIELDTRPAYLLPGKRPDSRVEEVIVCRGAEYVDGLRGVCITESVLADIRGVPRCQHCGKPRT